MSDRVTSVRPRDRARTPDGHIIAGLGLNGRVTRAEAITSYRAHYQRQLEEAQAALAVPDDGLIVYTYLGVWAQKNRQEVTD